ncbi:MAG: histidine kinase [Lachnospiraceae bacterium]|nr:histidine kinase [Lachnospiraceae bacterium]
MRKNTTKQGCSILGNRFFMLLLSFYFVLLFSISCLACYFSYQQKKEALFSQFDTTYVQLLQEYRNITDNFWQIYMPIFESNSNHYVILREYFRTDSPDTLTPMEKSDLNYTLTQMLLRDNDIQWIAVYNPNRYINYIIYNDGTSIHNLPTDFPYNEELLSPSRKMEIYGARTISSNTATPDTFAICSSVTPQIGEGKIMVGYSTATLKSICTNIPTGMKSLNYVLTNKGQIVFDASGKYDAAHTYCTDTEGINIVNASTHSNQKLYVKSETCGLRTSLASYYVSWWEYFLYCHSLTPLLLAIIFIFGIVSILGYMGMLHMINKEVSVIQNGLDEISENQLDYQLPTNFNQSGLPEIANSINRMTIRLKENINRAYYYELKQREAELSELQSKFNPHFLYNTLEMLRSRCNQSGDIATAELITQLGAIFRGFIGSKTFIPMTEELTFSKRYLALFGARYEDKVKIYYDFDKDILKYGIIRNLFQPLIENYFVHGFDTSNEENYILFKGKSLDEKTMILTVEDNGCGMSDEEIERLNAKLHEPIQISTESYGLKNLHQRLQLFYGEGYGLTICQNPNSAKGISIQMTALKMTYEEYEQDKKNVSSAAK